MKWPFFSSSKKHPLLTFEILISTQTEEISCNLSSIVQRKLTGKLSSELTVLKMVVNFPISQMKKINRTQIFSFNFNIAVFRFAGNHAIGVLSTAVVRSSYY